MTVTNATIKIGMMKYLAFIMVLLSAEEPDYACMIRIGICENYRNHNVFIYHNVVMSSTIFCNRPRVTKANALHLNLSVY